MINRLFIKIGSFALNPSRFFYYVLALPIIIFCSVFALDFNLFFELKEKEDSFNSIQKTALINFKKRKKQLEFLKDKTASDPFFIDKELEGISFLEEEKTVLQKMAKHNAFSSNNLINDRLRSLTNENRLSFIEDNIQTSPYIRETEEKQRFPIQINENDLKKLLSIIEEQNIENFNYAKNRPQLLITKFFLQKNENKNFSLEMQLLKREFFKNED
ncbi:MAG: hypothetical protein HZB76_03420 [Chlamydiae bacterium]|nr:hypothetical protein [Chlamydiota bacterium]